MVINHDFRFLAPICICTLGISKYLLIFGFVTFHILDIWKNLYLQMEKTHFQKPTLFVWWCFTEKCHALNMSINHQTFWYCSEYLFILVITITRLCLNFTFTPYRDMIQRLYFPNGSSKGSKFITPPCLGLVSVF